MSYVQVGAGRRDADRGDGQPLQKVAGGFVLHRRTDLASQGALPCCSPTCRDDVRRRWDESGARARGHEARQQMQRHDLRRRAQSHRLRARDLDLGPRDGRRAARGRLPRISRARSSTARTTFACAPTARSTLATLGTAAWPVSASSGRANWVGRGSIASLRTATLHLLVERDEFTQPNGLCFSPDERRLYVNDTTRAHHSRL